MYFLSASVAMTIFTVQNRKNSDTWVTKGSVVHTVEVNKVK